LVVGISDSFFLKNEVSAKRGQLQCLLTKRLERGRFVWPQADSGSVSLSVAQLSMLLEGIDWRRPERTWQPRAAA